MSLSALTSSHILHSVSDAVCIRLHRDPPATELKPYMTSLRLSAEVGLAYRLVGTGSKEPVLKFQNRFQNRVLGTVF